ncbi:hypothetical protein [Streptomyces sp. NRRL WC-3725]|uniref:recombination directionality factor n=1 Tax=Streptomyces sp. NRRL WC-3725 TaxID=1463933 RepID=UPI002D219653|nr:hypothetical protein [Streptomyces sp. NRRL WC-3725]
MDRFRFTSASRPLLEKVAALYGGTVADWTPANGGPAAHEVITDARRVPILVPPQPVSQYYELWSGGGCQRRCDGITELLTDRACPCGPDPERGLVGSEMCIRDRRSGTGRRGGGWCRRLTSTSRRPR